MQLFNQHNGYMFYNFCRYLEWLLLSHIKITSTSVWAASNLPSKGSWSPTIASKGFINGSGCHKKIMSC